MEEREISEIILACVFILVYLINLIISFICIGPIFANSVALTSGLLTFSMYIFTLAILDITVYPKPSNEDYRATIRLP